MKILNRKYHQHIAIDQPSDIHCKDFMKTYRECTSKEYSFMVIDTTLLSDKLLRFVWNF